MTSISKRSEGVRAGLSGGIHWGFLLAVLLTFIAMMLFIPGRDIIHSGTLASANSAATNKGARLFAPAPQGENPCAPPAQSNVCIYGADPPVRSDFSRAAADGQTFKIILKAVPVGKVCPLLADQFGTQTDASWIRVQEIVDDDQRNPIVKYEIQENRSKPRTGIIQVTRDGQVVACHEVTQAGCGYTVAPDQSRELEADGDPSQLTDAFTVTTTPDNACDYEVKIGAGFINIDGGPGIKSGTKTFSYSVTPNTSPTGREAFITVEEKTNGLINPPHKVRQKGRTVTPGGCNYTFSDFPSTFAPPGSSGSFQVQTTDTCKWIARSDVPWVKLSDALGVVRNEVAGMGTDDVGFTVESTSTFRTGSITILNEQRQTITTFDFIQFGEASNPGDPCPSYKITPQSAKFLAGGGEGSFEIEVGTGCKWTVRPNVSWIKVKDNEGNVVSEITDVGRRVISYVVDRNVDPIAGTDDRTDRIPVLNGAGVEVNAHTITQDGALPEERICTFSVSPDESFVGEGGGTFAFTVNTSGAGCQPVPISSVPWISITVKKNEVIFDVGQWTGADKRERSGEIKIGNISHKVTQTAGGAGGISNGECPSGAIKLNQTFYGTLSRTSGRADCTIEGASAFSVDKYRLILTEKTRVAINVAAIDFDPKVTLFAGKQKIDDDGGGFRNARVPRLPRKEEFISLDQGEYQIEVTSFDSSKVGNYAVYVASDNESAEPVILGAVIEGKTLLVIGENFDKDTALFIDNVEEKKVKNAQSRTRTALIGLKSASKIKKAFKEDNKTSINLQVKNPRSNKVPDIFVFPKPSGQ